MSHRVIIINAVSQAYADPAVRAEMTPNQCSEIDAILACSEPTPQQFRELTHRLNRLYAQDD